MPFLLKFLNQIKHESALQMLATEQSKEKVTLGIKGMEESIQMATGRHGVHLGETINLYGPSGGGKSWALSLLLEHALQLDSNDDVIYLDLDGRFVLRRHKNERDNTLSEQPDQGQNYNERFHLFQPNRAQLLATIQGLDSWFYRHTNKRVTMVLVDGIAALNGSFMDTLRRLQRKWSFVLVITSLEPQLNTLCNYRFHVYKKLDQIEMKLTSLSPSSPTPPPLPHMTHNNNNNQPTTTTIPSASTTATPLTTLSTIKAFPVL